MYIIIFSLFICDNNLNLIQPLRLASKSPYLEIVFNAPQSNMVNYDHQYIKYIYAIGCWKKVLFNIKHIV